METIKVWSCKIGPTDSRLLPQGADGPMRRAVSVAFKMLTGHDPEALFSGWGASFSESELAVIENREPDPALVGIECGHSNYYTLAADNESLRTQLETITKENSALRERAEKAEAIAEKAEAFCDEFAALQRNFTASESARQQAEAERDEARENHVREVRDLSASFEAERDNLKAQLAALARQCEQTERERDGFERELVNRTYSHRAFAVVEGDSVRQWQHRYERACEIGREAQDDLAEALESLRKCEVKADGYRENAVAAEAERDQAQADAAAMRDALIDTRHYDAHRDTCRQAECAECHRLRLVVARSRSLILDDGVADSALLAELTRLRETVAAMRRLRTLADAVLLDDNASSAAGQAYARGVAEFNALLDDAGPAIKAHEIARETRRIFVRWWLTVARLGRFNGVLDELFEHGTVTITDAERAEAERGNG